MSWQQNAVAQRSVGAPSGHEERDSGPTRGDSSILRYIKTLTSHQTNAKQQRMDQYLQKVKHVHQTERVKGLKPPRYPTATNERQTSFVKAPVTNLRSKTASRKQQKLPDSSSIEPSERKTQENLACPKQKNRLRPKRSYEGNRSNRSLKKSKRAPTKQQIATIRAWDRFRLNSTWLQGKSQTRVSEKVQSSTTPVAGTTAKHIPLLEASNDWVSQAQAPPIAKSELGYISGEMGDHDVKAARSVQPVPAKESTARPVSAAVRDDVWANSNQDSTLPTPVEVQPEPLSSQQEDAVPTYDPLSTIMESIYL